MQIPGQGHVQGPADTAAIRPPVVQNTQQLAPNTAGAPQVLPQTSGQGVSSIVTKGNPSYNVGTAVNVSRQEQANATRAANQAGVKWAGRSKRSQEATPQPDPNNKARGGAPLPAAAAPQRQPAPVQAIKPIPKPGVQQPTPAVPKSDGFYAIDLSGFYQPSYTQYEVARTQYINGLLAPLSETARVLDLGSGVGRYFAQSHLREGLKRQVFAIEGRPMLEMEMRRNLTDRNLPVSPIRGDLNKADLIPGLGKFELVQAFSILEHLRNPEQIISQVSAALTDNGYFIVEAQVAGDDQLELEKVAEPGGGKDFFGALDGQGVRFGRSVLGNLLVNHFQYVYQAGGVPAHASFMPSEKGYRVILVASRKALSLPQLVNFTG